MCEALIRRKEVLSKRVLAGKLFQIRISMGYPVKKEAKREKTIRREILKFKFYRMKLSGVI